MPITYSPISDKLVNFTRLFVFSRFLGSSNFDHDAFTHHA